MPVCPYDPSKETKEDDLIVECSGVIQVQYYVVLNDIKAIDFYQHMSFNIDTRITLNYEVYNATHGLVAGIFLGSWAAFIHSLQAVGVSEMTPLTLSGFIHSSKNETNFAQAITDLTQGGPMRLTRPVY